MEWNVQNFAMNTDGLIIEEFISENCIILKPRAMSVSRLTPFDAEVFLMIKSITDEEPESPVCGNCSNFENEDIEGDGFCNEQNRMTRRGL